jgi:hypothetical protein
VDGVVGTADVASRLDEWETDGVDMSPGTSRDDRL